MKPPSTSDSDLFRIVLENTDDGIFLLRAIRNQEQQIVDFAYQRYNARALSYTQKDASEIEGKTMLEVFPGNVETGLFRDYCALVDQPGQEPLRKEQFYDYDGLCRWFLIIAKASGEDLLIIFRDISEYKNALSEKERSKNVYDILVKTLPGIDVALIDQNLTFEIAKGAPLTAFGYSQPVHRQNTLFRDLPHAVSEKVAPLCQDVLKGKSLKMEITTEEGLYQVNLVPAKTKEGIFGVLLVSMDIGIFSESEDELRNKLYVLESAKESLEQFAYVASHDLQEPLRKIRAFGDRLTVKYGEQLQGSGQDYIARMQNAAERMQRLIDDLLQYSRVGRVRGEAQEVNLSDLIGEVLENLEDSIENSQAQLVYDGLPTIEGEVWQLRQLFQNLISNAVKFRRKDVPPVIRVTSREIPFDELSRLRKDHWRDTTYYEIEVIDNGIGFDEKYLDRIFDIFQRLHGRNEYSGTGIGLAICRKIVENHYGTITARAVPNQGAVFSLVLPKNQPHER